MVTITNPAAINFTVNAPVPEVDDYQAASFGANTPAGSGGWRPQLANGTIENIDSYDGLVSGSLGSHSPTVSSGRLVFTGAAGCPNGAVLRVSGVSGRVYDVTMTQVSDRKDIATDADVDADPGVTENLGLTIVVRQDARIGARDRTVGGTAWLSASTQGECDDGITSPITLRGEGPVKPGDTGFAASLLAGEYHCHSIRSLFPSSITIRNLRFADQKTKNSLLVESTVNRQNQNITVRECYFRIDYDVDGAGDWSTGFPSTGYELARLLWATGQYTRDMTVMDNYFFGGYVSCELGVSGTIFYVGNYHSQPYYDYRKTYLNVNRTANCCRIEGGNFYGLPTIYSVNENLATAPHLDVDQATSDDTVQMVYDEARIVWHNNDAPFQSRFYSERPDTDTTGTRFSFAGDMQLVESPHIASVDYADNVVIDRLFAIPNNVASFPIGGGINRVLFGTAKVGDGGNIGAHRITNSVYGSIGYDTYGPTSGDVTETSVVKYQGQSGAYFSSRLAQWANWGSLPVDPTYAEALPYFEPVNASDFDTKSPFDYVTAGSPLQSDYTISDTLRPVPTLSSLTVTDEATAAFTVVTDIATNSTVHWAVFLSEVTDPLSIVMGLDGTTAAEASGLDHRGNSAGTVTGGGTASLGTGSYWLCVCQYNGPKKVDVITASFSV
jgi:hypothetical protein